MKPYQSDKFIKNMDSNLHLKALYITYSPKDSRLRYKFKIQFNQTLNPSSFLILLIGSMRDQAKKVKVQATPFNQITVNV